MCDVVFWYRKWERFWKLNFRIGGRNPPDITPWFRTPWQVGDVWICGFYPALSLNGDSDLGVMSGWVMSGHRNTRLRLGEELFSSSSSTESHFRDCNSFSPTCTSSLTTEERKLIKCLNFVYSFSTAHRCAVRSRHVADWGRQKF